MAGPTYANLGMGPGTVSIGGTDVYTKGPPSVTCEIETAFGTVEGGAAPFAARLVNKQFGISGSSAEGGSTIISAAWDALGAMDDTATETSIVATFPQGTFTMAKGYAVDGGSMDGDPADSVAFTWAFKAISDWDDVGSVWEDQIAVT